MNILQTLLENDILTEESKKEIEEAIAAQLLEAVEEAVKVAKEEAEISVRAELAEQFVTDKEALVEALDTKVQQFLESELQEFKDDIENFRDLETEYAEKLVNVKKELAECAKKDFTQLINILNEFLEERVEAEMKELKEDIEEVKKIRFGAKVYESVKETFEREYFDKDEINKNAKEAEDVLKRVTTDLREAKKELNHIKRDTALTETLSSLSGRPKEVMAAILENTPTDKIQKVYDQFIGRVLNESVVEETEEKEEKVLAENSKTQSGKGKVVTETVAVNGDSGDDLLIEDEEGHGLSKEETARLRDLIGID
jgi:hypothetical protein